jgi:pyruvate/2-oxoglutarate dehydrogenase complex dihydrolipoamide acyltransferase (E2) component
MATQILMPALSPTMEEGTLAKWLVKEGDTVKSGQILAEIETDKATMEFEAVDEGVIGRLLVAEGTAGVKVNTPIAEMAGEEGASAAPAPAGLARPERYRQGGYVRRLPQDPWGQPYQYRRQSAHGGQFDVFSYGADRKEGGEGNDADLGNWEG